MPVARWSLAGVLTVAVAVLPGGPTAADSAPAAAPRAAQEERGPVVLVGVPGLTWADASPARTPALWQIASTGGVGALSVRTVAPTTCPADGWLTVGAGRRAQAFPRGPAGCLDARVVAAERGATVAGWADIVARNAALPYDADLGALGAALGAGRACAQAVGPGAALALADRGGRVASYVADPAIDLADVDLARCALTVVDAGTVTEGRGREGQVRTADAVLGAVRAQLPAGATLLVAGLADADRTAAHLGVAAATAERYDGRWLATSSTRQHALVQLTDVTPTLLDLVGLERLGSAVGAPWRPGAPRPASDSDSDGARASATVERLRDLDRSARVVAGVVPWFFTLLIALQLLLYAGAAVALRREWGGPSQRRRVLALTRRAALAFAAVPVATFLANLLPWWRATVPLLPLVAVVAGWTALVTTVALVGPWRRRPLGPFAVVASVTALVLGIDVVTGSRLQLSSLMGYSPLVAGRFYGFGNVAFALFATGALLGVAGWVEALVLRGQRRLAGALVAAVGVAAVAVDGSPAWGADFGGVLALVPGFAVLALLVAGVRVSPLRLALVCAAGAAVVSVVAVIDWLRPAAERTHLGRFVQQVLDGELATVISRKLAANVGLLTSSSLTLLVPFAVLFTVLVLMRPVSWHAAALDAAYRRSPTLRAGLVATLTAMLVGFAVNDSGIAIPAVALTVAIPLTLAASVGALEREGQRPLTR